MYPCLSVLLVCAHVMLVCTHACMFIYVCLRVFVSMYMRIEKPTFCPPPPQLVPLFLMPMSLFAGLLFNRSDLPTYLVWLDAISTIKYGYQAISIKQWEGYVCHNTTVGCIWPNGQAVGICQWTMHKKSMPRYVDNRAHRENIYLYE